jgi:hypothetical protein
MASPRVASRRRRNCGRMAASGWQLGRAAANCLFEATARRGETRSASAIANACWLCDRRHVEVLSPGARSNAVGQFFCPGTGLLD